MSISLVSPQPLQSNVYPPALQPLTVSTHPIQVFTSIASLLWQINLTGSALVVTFKATDDDGESATTTATITVASPAYEPAEEWPSSYNGVTPDSSFGLAFDNFGVLNSSSEYRK